MRLKLFIAAAWPCLAVCLLVPDFAFAGGSTRDVTPAPKVKDPCEGKRNYNSRGYGWLQKAVSCTCEADPADPSKVQVTNHSAAFRCKVNETMSITRLYLPASYYFGTLQGRCGDSSQIKNALLEHYKPRYCVDPEVTAPLDDEHIENKFEYGKSGK